MLTIKAGTQALGLPKQVQMSVQASMTMMMQAALSSDPSRGNAPSSPLVCWLFRQGAVREERKSKLECIVQSMPKPSWQYTRNVTMYMQLAGCTRCAAVPQRSFTISSTVWAVGARLLIWTASTPNSRICMVAPAAYLQAGSPPHISTDLQLIQVDVLTG